MARGMTGANGTIHQGKTIHHGVLNNVPILTPSLTINKPPKTIPTTHTARRRALLRLHSSILGPLQPSPLPTSIIKRPRNANPDLTLGINQGDPPALQGTFRSLSRMITRRNR